MVKEPTNILSSLRLLNYVQLIEARCLGRYSYDIGFRMAFITILKITEWSEYIPTQGFISNSIFGLKCTAKKLQTSCSYTEIRIATYISLTFNLR